MTVMCKLLYALVSWVDEFFKGRFHRICDFRHAMERQHNLP